MGDEPHYTIHQPAAWDFLDLQDEWLQLAERADAICFGSLAQRNSQSRQTIQALAAETSAACIRVFDVNLRAPFYSAEVIEESLELATVVKMNEEEAPRLIGLLGLPGSASGERQGQSLAEGQSLPQLRSGPNACSTNFPRCRWRPLPVAAAAACWSRATSGTSIRDFRSNLPTGSALGMPSPRQ